MLADKSPAGDGNEACFGDEVVQLKEGILVFPVSIHDHDDGRCIVARPYLNYPAYFPSKGAIPTITRTMAIELARRNPAVRVNCILPGPVMLPDDLSEAEVQGAVSGTLLKRPGRPENVADAVINNCNVIRRRSEPLANP